MAKKHTHKYYKGFLNSVRVWACALPDCSHYMPKHLERMVSGKASICWKCGNEMILDPINMEKDKPICDDCSTTGSSATLDYLKEHGIISNIE